MGIGGALIALTSVAFALTFLPATLGMLGPRVERLRLPNPIARLSSHGLGSNRVETSPSTAATTRRTGLWERVASAVMARPVVVMLPILALLLALGIPFLGERQGLPGADVLPTTAEARSAWDTIEASFPTGETRPVDLLVTVQGNPLSAQNAAALADYSARIAGLPGVTRVDGPFSITSPTGGQLSSAAIVAAVSGPPISRPAALNAAIASMVRGSTVHPQAISPLVGTPGAESLIQSIRRLAPGSGISASVGGEDAASLDFLNAQNSELPIAIVFILIAMALMLLLQFGSVVIPIKAVVMTLLSLTASFGALVWIFQDGNLSGLLGFESPGFTIAIVPILMFSIIFGLSMDYEVLLLSRIQEAYRKTGDTSQAVVEGLAKTGRVITGAAVIMVSVFAAFGLADLIVIKSLGIGMAIAVLLDATVIRALLVPAAMRLLGPRAWWAPARLSRLSGRLGFSHVETDYECDSPEPEVKAVPKPGAQLGRPTSEPAAG
jgi:RND superfamily putative drug exporter